MLSSSKAISDFMATIILIAVTITVIAGFLAWFTTTYYTLTKPEILRVLQETKIYYDLEKNSWILRLHVRNVGDSTGEIYKIEVAGWEEIETKIIINPGEEIKQEIELSKNYTQGTWYLIRLHLKSGTTYLAQQQQIPAT
ncbi:MAG: hypothetical protein QXI15_07480 [Zestosphaera sp.]